MSLMEPLLIIVLGGMVGFIVIALFLPLICLIQNLQRAGGQVVESKNQERPPLGQGTPGSASIERMKNRFDGGARALAGQGAGSRNREIEELGDAGEEGRPTSGPVVAAEQSPPAIHHPPSTLRPSALAAFTLVELLVTITIIGILAGVTFGALQMARHTGREAATKATIAKLNNIIMERYETYMTRRVPISTIGNEPATGRSGHGWTRSATFMRMEMPDARADVTSGAVTFAWGSVPEPALHRIYALNPPSATNDSAQCLFLTVSVGSPESMEQFSQSEIGVTSDNHRVFVDGWGTPIAWLRWAPGFSNWHGVTNPPAPAGSSDIQTGNPLTDADPFDPRNVDVDSATPPNPRAFHLIPLICSAGPDKKFGILDLDATTGRGIILTSTTFSIRHLAWERRRQRKPLRRHHQSSY